MLQKLIRNKTIYAVASIVIGIVMIIKGGRMADDIVRIIGWLLIGTGAAYAVNYFTSSERDEVQLVYAILAAVGGILVVALAKTIVGLIPILAGIALIVLFVFEIIGIVRALKGSGKPLPFIEKLPVIIK